MPQGTGAMMKKKTPQPSRAANTTATLRDVLNDAIANTARPIDLAAILQTATSQGIAITWREVQEVANLRRSGTLVTPSFVTDFQSSKMPGPVRSFW
jgi:hypothetical protein